MRIFLVLAAVLVGCGGIDNHSDTRFDPTDALAIDRETGKPELDALARNAGLEAQGPLVGGLNGTTDVWTVHRRWYERSPEQGIAWPEESDLTWDEKYASWIDVMEQTTADDGSVTVELLTPLGQRVPSPSLECAEMGMFLRTVFASWYGLPFFMTAQHPSLGKLHFGHFGVVDSSGRRAPGYPEYAARYPDETARGMAALDAWPSDFALRERKLTVLADDLNAWLGPDAYAGAYFDHVLLNKRVGHFLHVLLTSFGSMHLAYAENTFDLAPAAMREGDLLVHRWQAQGIGHVMVIKEVEHAEVMSAEIIFGSMPRIQPYWMSAEDSRYYFLDGSGGGPEEDGVNYAALGGGLKRWRTPVVKGGRWMNIIPVVDREQVIDTSDLEAVAGRLHTLEQLFGTLTLEDEVAGVFSRIELARNNLRQRPASCANRMRREAAFADLYALLEPEGWSREEIDLEYRITEDYVFAELEYGASKTCCWNSTTPDMFSIVMDHANEQLAGLASDECADPPVFMARDGGYALYSEYAAATDREDLWVAWSEDETCDQRDVTNDSAVTSVATAFCALDIEVEAPPSAAADPCEGFTYEGECDGNTVRWCEHEVVQEMVCDPDQTCGLDTAANYYNCLD